MELSAELEAGARQWCDQIDQTKDRVKSVAEECYSAKPFIRHGKKSPTSSDLIFLAEAGRFSIRRPVELLATAMPPHERFTIESMGSRECYLIRALVRLIGQLANRLIGWLAGFRRLAS